MKITTKSTINFKFNIMRQLKNLNQISCNKTQFNQNLQVVNNNMKNQLKN